MLDDQLEWTTSSDADGGWKTRDGELPTATIQQFSHVASASAMVYTTHILDIFADDSARKRFRSCGIGPPLVCFSAATRLLVCLLLARRLLLVRHLVGPIERHCRLAGEQASRSVSAGVSAGVSARRGAHGRTSSISSMCFCIERVT